MAGKSERNLVWAIRIGIGLILFTPLVLGPFGLNMSEYPKAVFFRSLAELIFVFYVFLILLNPAYIPKKSILLFSVIFFDAILIIASIFGVNFYRSFFGDMARGEGIILYLHLLVFFIILLGLFRKKEDWLWLFRATVIASGLSSLAALLQQGKLASFYGMDLAGARLSGTLSNPDLFGSYLVLSIFLTFFLLVSERKKNWKAFWIFLIVLNFYTLISSGTRAAWIGFAFGIISIYVLNYRNLKYKTKIFSLLAILAVSVLILFFPLLIEKVNLEDSSFSRRILSIYNIEISDRLNLWEISFRAFKDKPILGWGFESFSFVSDKYFKTGYTIGTYFDRPHNKVMEILASGGIIGLAGYFLIFFILFYLILKYSKLWNGYNNKPGILFGSIIFGFFVSGFIQNIFCFDHIGTYILFFLATGFVNNNFSNLAGADFEKFGKPSSAGKIIIVCAVSVFMAFVMYQINIKPTVAAMYFPAYIRYESSDFATALSGYKIGISAKTLYDNDLVIAFADRSIFLLENSYGQYAGDKAVEGLLGVKPILYEAIIKKDMRPCNVYELLSRIDEWLYIVKKDPNYLGDMEKDINRALLFNSNIPVFYRLRGEMEILQNENDDGEKDIKKSCEIDSRGCNGNEAELYKMIGIAYFKKGDIESTIKNFQKTLDIDYAARKKGLPPTIENPGPFIDSVAIMYYNYFKDFKNSKEVYKKGIEAYPEYKNFFEQRLNMMMLGSD